MFIGHYALGLAAKRLAPRTSLGALVAAPTLADLLWPLFLLLGWERATITPSGNPFLNLTFGSYPLSHSLVTLIGWAVVFGLLYALRTQNRSGAVILGALVVSHWVLDYVTHVPDMPLWPGGPKVGLGLWRSPTATVAIESVMFIAGAWLYLGATRARDGIGRWALWTFLAFLVLSYAGALFSPPPPTVHAIAIGGLAFGWLFVGWAWWGDRHREGAAA